jgi:cysteine desulfurase
MRENLVYVDNNASTRVRAEVMAAMLPWFTQSWANPSSTIHASGRAARSAVEQARGEVAALLGCEDEELIFTSGASEANALAVGGVRPAGKGPVCIITSDIEHRSVLSAAYLAEERGAKLVIVPVGEAGYVSAASLAELPIETGTLVSLQWVNNETGAVNPIAQIAQLVKDRGGLLHVDAAQAPGKIEIDLRHIPIDLLTISAHKFYGPKGAGALFIRRGTPLEPLIRGGHQERGRRAGTENVPGIVGLGEACRLVRLEGATARSLTTELRNLFEQTLKARLPQTIFIEAATDRVGNTTVCAWDGLSNRDILRDLDAASICAASGSACTSEATGTSHVLRAMKVPSSVAHSAVRISFGRDNTLEEAAYVAGVLIRVVTELRETSPERSRVPAVTAG